MYKIAFLAPYNVYDEKYSCTPARFFMEGIKKYFDDVIFVPPVKLSFSLTEKLRRKIIHVNYLLNGYEYRYELDRSLNFQKAQIYKEKLSKLKFDAIFSWFTTFEFAFINLNAPIIINRDATYPSLFNSYDDFKNLDPIDVTKLIQLEQAAFNNTDILIFSSNWGIKEFQKYYYIKDQKPMLRVAYRGANIHVIPNASDVISCRINSKKKCINLLLLTSPGGWARKGGDKAVDIISLLNQVGFSSVLYIFGDVPEKLKKNCPEYIKIEPYLRKFIPAEEEILKQQLLMTDFLLLPTQADFTPNVICEANAYGIPVLSTNITAIPEMVVNGVSGFLFSIDAPPREYVSKIIQIISNDTTYFNLRKGSRLQYEAKLNWENTSKQVASYIQDMIFSFPPKLQNSRL